MAEFDKRDPRWVVQDLSAAPVHAQVRAAIAVSLLPRGAANPPPAPQQNMGQWYWTEKDLFAWAKPVFEEVSCPLKSLHLPRAAGGGAAAADSRASRAAAALRKQGHRRERHQVQRAVEV